MSPRFQCRVKFLRTPFGFVDAVRLEEDETTGLADDRRQVRQEGCVISKHEATERKGKQFSGYCAPAT
jgi:hypothetical protein